MTMEFWSCPHPHFTFWRVFSAPYFWSEAPHISSSSKGQAPNVISIKAITNSWGPSPCHLSEEWVRAFIGHDEYHFTNHLNKWEWANEFSAKDRSNEECNFLNAWHIGRGKIYHLHLHNSMRFPISNLAKTTKTVCWLEILWQTFTF